MQPNDVVDFNLTEAIDDVTHSFCPFCEFMARTLEDLIDLAERGVDVDVDYIRRALDQQIAGPIDLRYREYSREASANLLRRVVIHKTSAVGVSEFKSAIV